MHYNYVYSQIEYGELSQYPLNVLSGHSRVLAKYYKAEACEDIGNPLIEALPPLLDEDKIITISEQRIKFDSENKERLTNRRKRIHIDRIRRVRFFLPFQLLLEEYFWKTLVRSYHLRTIVDCNSFSVRYQDNDFTVNMKSIGYIEDTSASGFSILGYTGCGKSCALKTLTDHYPQTIVHQFDDGHKSIQISYLTVVCGEKSSLPALYNDVGKSFDYALGNNIPYYEREIKSKKTLEEKESKIIELIETFSVGVIVFDEIQNMPFSLEKSNIGSFGNLLRVNNVTKVGLVVIGTQDSFYKMFPTPQIARRVGNIILASDYCNRKDYVAPIIKDMFRYQWVDSPLVLTNDIVNAFYEATRGVIGLIIDLYIAVYDDILVRTAKKELSASRVIDIAKQQLWFYNFSSIQKANSRAQFDLIKESSITPLDLESMIRNLEKQDYGFETALAWKENRDKAEIKKKRKESVILLIKNMSTSYNTDSISAVFDSLYNKNIAKSDEELAELVFNLLKTQKSDRRRGKKSARRQQKSTTEESTGNDAETPEEYMQELLQGFRSNIANRGKDAAH